MYAGLVLYYICDYHFILCYLSTMPDYFHWNDEFMLPIGLELGTQIPDGIMDSSS